MTRRTALRRSREIVDKLESEEEYFPLRGNDRATPIVIKLWAHVWNLEIKMGVRPESDRAQIKAGLDMARRMEIWLRDLTQKREHEATEFSAPMPDGSRVPMTGQHRKLEHNTTSGANDG